MRTLVYRQEKGREEEGEREETTDLNQEVGSECGAVSQTWTFLVLAAEPSWKSNMWAIRL